MQFSEHFDLDEDFSEVSGAFDPILHTDTRLFVDPFLIFKESQGEWADAHGELIGYFDSAFKLLGGHENNPRSLQYKRVVQLLRFPEPQEFCLGYVGSGTRGAGSGLGLARQMTRAMREAIARGLDKGMAHFEELGVLVERINRDRISDITLSILKPRFIKYTQEIAEKWEVETKPVLVPQSVYDSRRRAWEPGTFDLPVNPHNKRAVLLTPNRFLRELPTLNANDWWEFSESPLRDDLNLTVMENVDSHEIVRLARSRAELVREWAEAREGLPATPYPVTRDPKGFHNWNVNAMAIVRDNPVDLSSETSIYDVVAKIIKVFKHYVEQQGGWSLLYNDDTNKPKREAAVQLLFKGIVEHYCRANNIRLDREVYLGRGPVDFAFTRGASERVLLEIKKMTNSDYWHGLETQLTSYLLSDECDYGWFLAVRYTDKPASKQRTKELQSRTEKASKETGFQLQSEWIDARPKASASNI
jgi:hypothetical protein